MGALRGLMPNLRGLRESRRQLYANVIRSIVLYWALIWAIKGVINTTRMRPLTRVQRRIDQRTIFAYCTVSGIAAGLVARSPPIDIVAKNRWEYYRLKLIESGSRGRGHRVTPLTPQIRARVRQEGQQLVTDEWRERLRQARQLNPGNRARTVLILLLDRWMSRAFGEVGFYPDYHWPRLF